jgi:hypothetical protein
MLGVAIRVRRMAQDFASRFAQRQDMDTIETGNKMAHDANAVVDAVIWEKHHGSLSKKDKITSFKDMYGYSAETMRKAQKFTRFVDVVNWKADITNWQKARYVYVSLENIKNFNIAYEKVIGKFKNGTGYVSEETLINFEKDAQNTELYLDLEKAYDAARIKMKESRTRS